MVSLVDVFQQDDLDRNLALDSGSHITVDHAIATRANTVFFLLIPPEGASAAFLPRAYDPNEHRHSCDAIPLYNFREGFSIGCGFLHRFLYRSKPSLNLVLQHFWTFDKSGETAAKWGHEHTLRSRRLDGMRSRCFLYLVEDMAGYTFLSLPGLPHASTVSSLARLLTGKN
jgi:hypothetical protein